MSDDDSKYPSELAERFQVRLPLGMRDRIKAAAEASNRSMNSEIVARLANSFEQRSILASDERDLNLAKSQALIAATMLEMCELEHARQLVSLRSATPENLSAAELLLAAAEQRLMAARERHFIAHKAVEAAEGRIRLNDRKAARPIPPDAPEE